MKLFRMILLVFAIGVPLPSHAAELSAKVLSCGKWIAEQANNNNLDEDYMGYKQWLNSNLSMDYMGYKHLLLRYIDGLAISDGNKFLDSADEESIFLWAKKEHLFAWMDNYCKNNPLSYMSDGAVIFYRDLKQRTQ